MKVLILTTLLFTAFTLTAQELSIPPNGNNQKAEVSQWIGLVKITITYHSPDVHDPRGADRKGHIWGDLVPFGFNDAGFGPSKSIPWRAGANESTTISFSHDVKIDGKDVRQGTYALFLDVEKDAPWTWILSSNIGWGSFQYDPQFDIVRISSMPEESPYTEWLTFGFDDRQSNTAQAYLQWENRRVHFRIDVPNINELYVAQMRNELQAWPGFNYKNWMNAALFCARQKINLEEALTWADKAITGPFRGLNAGKEEFETLQAKALVLMAMGRADEADLVMAKAVRLPSATAFDLFVYSRRLLIMGKKEKSLEVGLLGQKMHPAEKFWPYVGLGYTYSAMKDKKNAIKNWEIAIQNLPDDQKGNLSSYQAELKKAKEL